MSKYVETNEYQQQIYVHFCMTNRMIYRRIDKVLSISIK